MLAWGSIHVHVDTALYHSIVIEVVCVCVCVKVLCYNITKHVFNSTKKIKVHNV